MALHNFILIFHVISPHLVILRLTSQLVADRSQRLHLGTKQMALQYCTKVL